MKKPLLFLLIICMCLPSFAQTSIPLDSFYVPGSSWTEVATTEYSPCSAGNDVNVIGILYKIDKDSIIAGKTYHMLSSCQLGGYGNTVSCNTYFPNTNYVDSGTYLQPSFAMIRTDSNRVYFTLLVPQNDGNFAYDCDTVGKEELFYDFNLGFDSVVQANTLGDGIVVSAIDSVSLSNGTNVPRYNRSLIYGVGSEGGFLNYWNLYVCGPGPSASQFLLCYDNPHFSYHFSYGYGALPGNLQYDCFDMRAYVDSIQNTINNTPVPVFNIYPNPAADQLTITDTTELTSIIITNVAGNLVYSYYYGPTNYASVAQIDITSFPAGMYFVKVNGNKARKFVKQIPHR